MGDSVRIGDPGSRKRLATLAVAVGEESHTLEEVHEPYLIQSGLVQRTAQGRIITPEGLAAIGLAAATKE